MQQCRLLSISCSQVIVQSGGVGAEQPRLEVGVKAAAYPDFGQNREGGISAVNASSDIKFGVTVGRNDEDGLVRYPWICCIDVSSLRLCLLPSPNSELLDQCPELAGLRSGVRGPSKFQIFL